MKIYTYLLINGEEYAIYQTHKEEEEVKSIFNLTDIKLCKDHIEALKMVSKITDILLVPYDTFYK